MQESGTDFEKNIEKCVESFKEKYGYDKSDFTVNFYPNGDVRLSSIFMADISLDDNFGEGQLKTRLETIWKDMYQLILIKLDKINPESPWYKPNMEKK